MGNHEEKRNLTIFFDSTSPSKWGTAWPPKKKHGDKDDDTQPPLWNIGLWNWGYLPVHQRQPRRNIRMPSALVPLFVISGILPFLSYRPKKAPPTAYHVGGAFGYFKTPLSFWRVTSLDIPRTISANPLNLLYFLPYIVLPLPPKHLGKDKI